MELTEASNVSSGVPVCFGGILVPVKLDNVGHEDTQAYEQWCPARTCGASPREASTMSVLLGVGAIAMLAPSVCWRLALVVIVVTVVKGVGGCVGATLFAPAPRVPCP